MKKFALFILSATISIMVSGQVVPPFLLEEAQITLPTAPGFPDQEILVQGQIATSIEDYLSFHVQFPLEPSQRNLAGTEVVEFEVSESGELSSFRVINSVSEEIDREVIRVLETTSGNWTPGLVNGIPSPQTSQVTMVFKPHRGYDLIGNAREYQDRGNRQMFLRNDPERALKYYNQAVKLLPFEESILSARCLCRYELGDDDGAREDLDRIMALNPVLKDQLMKDSYNEFLTQLRRSVENDYMSDK